MNEENFEQLIKMELDSLPTYVRESLQSVDWLNKFQEVTHKHHLHIDEVGSLRTETLLVLLGIIDSPEYIGKAGDILEDTNVDLEAFIGDINEMVFVPVRDEIIRRKNEKDEEPKKPQNSGLSAFQRKLHQRVHTTQKQTDHSIKRKENHDPYQEPIE